MGAMAALLRHIDAPEDMDMKTLLFAGLLLVVLGLASLVVSIPRSETEGIKIGDANIGVQTTHSERVSPIISVVLIAGGLALTIAGARTWRAKS
jgi:hypothetical protein